MEVHPPGKERSRRSTGVPTYIEAYAASLSVQTFLPLLPLGLELLSTGSVSARTIALAASIHLAGTAASSRSRRFLSLGLKGSIFMAVALALIVNGESPVPHGREIAFLTILATILGRGIERYIRRGIDREPGFPFMGA